MQLYNKDGGRIKKIYAPPIFLVGLLENLNKMLLVTL